MKVLSFVKSIGLIQTWTERNHPGVGREVPKNWAHILRRFIHVRRMPANSGKHCGKLLRDLYATAARFQVGPQGDNPGNARSHGAIHNLRQLVPERRIR